MNPATRQIVKSVIILGTIVLGLVASGCTASTPENTATALRFEAQMEVNSEQEFHVSLGIRNRGPIAFSGDESFTGQMELSFVDGDRAGEPRARAEITRLAALEPNQTSWPMAYRCKLDPGAYRLTWGAEGYGTTTVEFKIVEREGRLYLGS